MNQGPAISVRMLGDGVGEGGEDLGNGDVEKGDVCERDAVGEEITSGFGGVLLADEEGAAFEAGEALSGFLLVFVERRAPGLAPFFDAIEVIVGDEAGPEFGDLIVVESEVADGDGASGEAAEDDAVGVGSEFLTGAGNVLEGVVDGGLSIAPPCDFVFGTVLRDIGKSEPDGLAAGEAVAESGVFNLAGGAGRGVVVPCELDDEGIGLFSSLPVGGPFGGEVEDVVDLGVLVFGWSEGNSLSCCGLSLGKRWDFQRGREDCW